MRKIIILIVVCIYAISCKSQDCSTLKSTFSSYSQAIREVKASTFSIKESTSTTNSSWITSATYYSCNGETGYFIYTTNRSYQYIHQRLPIKIWKEFKNASSKGSYYNTHIKHKYKLQLY